MWEGFVVMIKGGAAGTRDALPHGRASAFSFPEVLVEDGDCYIDIWREANFEGESLRLYGPAEYAHLGFEQGDWSDQIGSLRVGPRAFVLAYRDRDFKDKRVAFGPNDEVADLRGWKFDDDIDSMRVIDSLKIFDRLLGRDSLPASVDEAPKRGKAKGKRR